jgi:hypothetical protein
MTELSVAVDKARKGSGAVGGSTGQPTVDAGASAGDVPAGGSNRASTRNHGGLVARLEQFKEQLCSAVAAASIMNHEDLGAPQSASEQLHQACEDLRHQWRGNAVAEGVPEASWMPLYEAEGAEKAGLLQHGLLQRGVEGVAIRSE